ncbi:STM4014 family protein [Sphingomonas sp. ASY06-1R]|uniref:STM4014 family protein n=1 Tax=Sphingomonas sp. ASY06-1R TaxID=3445771 RepID=UPI003FA20464
MRLENNRAAGDVTFPHRHLVVLGPVSGPRHDAFAQACIDRFGWVPAVLSWDKFLAAPERLQRMLSPGGYLRIDTPDQDVRAIAAVLAAGADEAAATGIETVPVGIETMLAQGDVGSPAQFAFGLVAGITLAERIAQEAGADISIKAVDVACAFDKTRTAARFNKAGLATPRGLPAIHGFEALADAMRAAACSRVFVKLRHGSAAAAMVALARHGTQWRALTTAMLVDGRVRATRAVRRLSDCGDIARLIDRLGPLGLHVEAWVPKISIDGHVADVRIVCVDGAEAFPVLRTSRHPMTNLHLGGARYPIARLIARIGAAAWAEVETSAWRAAALFPASDAIGIDIAVLNDGRRSRLLEANIFGDFVKDLIVGGQTPYSAQLNRIAQRYAAGARTAA